VPIVLRKGGGFYSADMMYQVRGALYASDADEFYSEEGLASWYGPGFHGKKTANGEIYDQFALTAAHKTLPIPSLARVTNLDNGRSILVRINDRGPFVADRIIDLSQASAAALDTQVSGVGRVRVDYVGVAPLDGRADAENAHLAEQPWAQGSVVAAVQQHRVASNTRVEPATSVVRTARHKTTIGKLVLPRLPRAARKIAVDTTPVALRSACWTCRDTDRP
jgi:rare lipoprotein A